MLDVFSYCLMPTHFHFIVKIKSSIKHVQSCFLTPEEKALKDFFICYAKSINAHYGRTGSLFQKKYKKTIITESEQLKRMFTYIHNNPIRAGLVENIEDWKFSSYNNYINDKISQSKSSFVYSLYGSKYSFIEFHKTYTNPQRERDFLFKAWRLPKSVDILKL